jgi:hypothetical protein
MMSGQIVMNGLYSDAVFLSQNGRLRGCLCLLLCLIDGLAKREYPTISGNRERYVKYLKSKLKSLGIDKSVRIEEKDALLHLAEIIYEYFRCNMVHEGDSRDSLSYEVQVEYEESGRFRFNGKSLMDRVNMKLIYKADWLTDILFQIIGGELDA